MSEFIGVMIKPMEHPPIKRNILNDRRIVLSGSCVVLEIYFWCHTVFVPYLRLKV